jgi:ketosteroid isomerase-like protein
MADHPKLHESAALTVELDKRDLLVGAYRDFNARRIDAVLARMQPDVDWPNGMEGGRVHGHDEVRAYWIRQWTILDPHVDPTQIEINQPDRAIVEVHQVVHDHSGNLLTDSVVHHVYTFRDGLIERMEIE